MAQQYSPDKLRSIGQVCGSHLPPASAVQGMYLYELQRATELERLFHDALFDVARAEARTKSQDTRITRLEQEISVLLRRHASREESEQRIKTAEADINALRTKLDTIGKQADLHHERMIKLEDKANYNLEYPQAGNDKTKALCHVKPSTGANQVNTFQTLMTALNTLQDASATNGNDIDILFRECNVTAAMMDSFNHRICHATEQASKRITDMQRKAAEEDEAAQKQLDDRIALCEQQARERAEHAVGRISQRDNEIEERLVKLEAQMGSRVVEIATATDRIALGEQQASGRVAEYEKHAAESISQVERHAAVRLATLEAQMESRISEIPAANSLLAQMHVHADQQISALAGQVQTRTSLLELQVHHRIDDITTSRTEYAEKHRFLQERVLDIDTRHCVRATLNESRLDKVEGLVRALTLQNSEQNASLPPQLLPIRTTNGQTLDLSVPKGKPLVPVKKESHAPGRVFAPGKQWMTAK